MENQPIRYSSDEEIEIAIETLTKAGDWPEGLNGDPQNGGKGRAIMMRRRLALLGMGIKLPPISL